MSVYAGDLACVDFVRILRLGGVSQQVAKPLHNKYA